MVWCIQGHSVTRKLNSSGGVESTQTLHNLDEGPAESTQPYHNLKFFERKLAGF